MPWPTGRMYTITSADHEWARSEAVRRGCTTDEALKAWIKFRQQRDIRAEEVFEANRPADRPSRQRCMYLWDDREGFEIDARSLGVDPEAQALIRIRPVPRESTVHRAFIDALDVLNNASAAAIAAAAERYWKGVPEACTGTEVLLIGSYEVIAILNG